MCAQIWLGAHLMLSNPYAPQPFRDLGRPEVRALLNDPQNLRFLAAMLRQVVEQAKAARQAPPTEQAA